MEILLSPQKAQPDTLYAAIDCDQFSAQVTAAYGICQRTAPFVVLCQNQESHKSTVWSVSPRAHELGIACGMPVMLVKKRYPHIEIVARDQELEQNACNEIKQILEEFSPDHEVGSAGKCLLNLSRTPAARRMTWNQIGESIKKRFSVVTRLDRVSLGISRTLLIAKILAKKARPDGTLICRPDDEYGFLDTLDCDLLPGLSRQCRESLKKYGIHRVCQLRKLGLRALMDRFGAEGEKLYGMTGGLYEKTRNTTPVAFHVETIFHSDINDISVLSRHIKYASDKFCYQIKTHDICIRQFTMALKYSDNKKTQKTVKLPCETNDFTAIADAASRMFTELYQRRVAIRSITISAKHAEPDSGQLNLFESQWERKQRQLAEGIVKVRNKFQFNSVVSGTNVSVSHI